MNDLQWLANKIRGMIMNDAQWLDCATEFQIDFQEMMMPVTISRFRQTQGLPLWGVLCSSRTLNRSGTWQLAPMPSDRDTDFLSEHRFSSKDEALAAYLEWKAANPGVWPGSIPASLP